MQKVLINYADRGYVISQRENAQTGLEIGGFDKVIQYSRKDLGLWMRWRHRNILRESRGAGYWLWKPYIVLFTLKRCLHDGDILVYCDSDARFVSSIDPLVEICTKQAEPQIVVFTLEDEHINRVWTKRDCFHNLGLDTPAFTDVPQMAGGFFICRRSKATIRFFEEWFSAVQDVRNVTDAPNVCGLPNYPGFREHRHDQSVLSLLARKYGLATRPDVSQWGDSRREPDLPRIIELTGRRD
jgi:hypothetical protein